MLEGGLRQSRVLVLLSLRHLRPPLLRQKSSRQSHWSSRLKFGSKSLVRNSVPLTREPSRLHFLWESDREGWLTEGSI